MRSQHWYKGANSSNVRSNKKTLNLLLRSAMSPILVTNKPWPGSNKCGGRHQWASPGIFLIYILGLFWCNLCRFFFTDLGMEIFSLANSHHMHPWWNHISTFVNCVNIPTSAYNKDIFLQHINIYKLINYSLKQTRHTENGKGAWNKYIGRREENILKWTDQL